MANVNLKNILLLGLAAYVAYTQRDRLKSIFERKDAEYTQYEVDGVKVNDYGSIQNPVSVEGMGMGRAAGQFASQANEATLAMSVESVGQNFNGRSFGL
jgi:hypothetical protein